MKLLQVCNVGSIVGGTAACAWSVTRSLPEFKHEVLFLSPISEETRRAFEPVPVRTVDIVRVEETHGADVVMLHNTPRERFQPHSRPTIGYRHSRCQMARTDISVDCSKWLAGDRGRPVLWQGVPRPRANFGPNVDGRGARALRDEVIVGRICTPRSTKWPAETLDDLSRIATAVPTARFELVGCPATMKSSLEERLQDRCQFYAASWLARHRMANWDVLTYSNRAVPESFGRTVAEAMRAGCVPVVDDLGGFAEQLDAGGGFLCRTKRDFVDTIRRLSDPVERREVARQAIAIGDERFSLAAFRDRLLPLLHAV